MPGITEEGILVYYASIGPPADPHCIAILHPPPASSSRPATRRRSATATEAGWTENGVALCA